MSSEQYFESPSFGPTAPRSALRIAPFVVLLGLVMYAAVVVSALTAPADGGTSRDATSSHVVSVVDAGRAVPLG